MSLDQNLFTLRLTPSSTDPSIVDLVDPAGNIHYRKQRITGPVYAARVYDYVSQSLLVTATAPSASSKVKILELRNPSVPVELKCLSGTFTLKEKRVFQWEEHEFEGREECYMIRKPDPPVLVAITKELALPGNGKVKYTSIQILDYNLNRFDISDRKGLEIVILTALLAFADDADDVKRSKEDDSTNSGSANTNAKKSTWTTLSPFGIVGSATQRQSTPIASGSGSGLGSGSGSSSNLNPSSNNRDALSAPASPHNLRARAKSSPGPRHANTNANALTPIAPVPAPVARFVAPALVPASAPVPRSAARQGPVPVPPSSPHPTSSSSPAPPTPPPTPPLKLSPFPLDSKSKSGGPPAQVQRDRDPGSAQQHHHRDRAPQHQYTSQSDSRSQSQSQQGQRQPGSRSQNQRRSQSQSHMADLGQEQDRDRVVGGQPGRSGQQRHSGLRRGDSQSTSSQRRRERVRGEQSGVDLIAQMHALRSVIHEVTVYEEGEIEDYARFCWRLLKDEAMSFITVRSGTSAEVQKAVEVVEATKRIRHQGGPYIELQQFNSYYPLPVGTTKQRLEDRARLLSLTPKQRKKEEKKKEKEEKKLIKQKEKAAKKAGSGSSSPARAEQLQIEIEDYAPPPKSVIVRLTKVEISRTVPFGPGTVPASTPKNAPTPKNLKQQSEDRDKDQGTGSSRVHVAAPVPLDPRFSVQRPPSTIPSRYTTQEKGKGKATATATATAGSDPIMSRPAMVATSTSPSHLRPKPTPTTTDRRAVSEVFPSTQRPVSQSVLSPPPRGALVVKPPAPALATNPTVTSAATSTPPRPGRSSSRPSQSQSQSASASPAQTSQSGARTFPASHPEPPTLSAAARSPSQRDFERDMPLTPPAMTYSSSSPNLRAYTGGGLSGESTSYSHPPPPRLNTWNGSDPDPDSDPAYRSEKLVLTPPPIPPRRTSTNGATRPRIEITEVEDAAPVAGPSRSRTTRVSDDDLAAPPTYTELPIEGESPIG